jgi:hypothetical protein
MNAGLMLAEERSGGEKKRLSGGFAPGLKPLRKDPGMQGRFVKESGKGGAPCAVASTPNT